MISAIMPTYNQAEYIREALDSVLGEVDELIVVDDGSTDETPTILEAYGGRTDLKVIRIDQNGGGAGAINAGFSHTSGDWATWVSSDNVYEPGWAKSMLKMGLPDVGVVYSAYWHGSKERVFHVPYEPDHLINDLNCFFGPSFIIRRDVWAAVGGHRGKISHDYDHWLRVEEECQRRGLKIVCHPEPTCLYRVHDQRVTVVRRHLFDADRWQAEARKRRGLA